MEWFGELPERWEQRYLSQICREKCVKNIGNQEANILSLSYGQIIRKRNIYSGLSPKDYATYQIADPGNIILRLTDLQNDHVSLRTGLVRERGIITSAYVCLQTYENYSYLQYLLHSYDTQKYLYGLGGGVRQSIGYKDIRYINLPLPPREEQDQIARYLDWKVTQINKLINAKKKQIALLQEQKQAVISSEICGEPIPLKRLLTTPLQYGANDSGTSFNEKLPRYIRITDITRDGQLKNEGKKSLSGKVAESYLLQDGDILLARSGATSGKAFLYRSIYGSCAFAGYLIRVSVDKNVLLPDYLLYMTFSSKYDTWKKSIFIQATIQNISAERYNYLQIPLPSLEKQQAIVAKLDESCAKIDKVTTAIQTEITLLHEYRTRLISDVVTGKLDVRGVEIPGYEAVEETADAIDNTELDETEGAEDAD